MFLSIVGGWDHVYTHLVLSFFLTRDEEQENYLEGGWFWGTFFELMF